MNVKRITILNTGRYGQVYLKMMNADWDLDVFTSIQLYTFGSVLLFLLLTFFNCFFFLVFVSLVEMMISCAHIQIQMYGVGSRVQNFLSHFRSFKLVLFVVYVVNCATSLRLLSWIIDNFVVLFRFFLFFFRWIFWFFDWSQSISIQKKKNKNKLIRTSRNFGTTFESNTVERFHH